MEATYRRARRAWRCDERSRARTSGGKRGSSRARLRSSRRSPLRGPPAPVVPASAHLVRVLRYSPVVTAKDATLPLALGRFRRWGLVALAFTAIGLLNFFIVLTSWRAEGNLHSAKYPFLWEMTGIYSVLVLLPALLVVMRRFPVTRGTLAWRLPLHLAA